MNCVHTFRPQFSGQQTVKDDRACPLSPDLVKAGDMQTEAC